MDNHKYNILNSLWLTLFFVTFLFISMCVKHLYLLQKMTSLNQYMALISPPPIPTQQNKQNFISIENVLLLPYQQKSQSKHLSKNNVLAKINIQLEMQDDKSLLEFKNQSLYIEEAVAVVLSRLTYQEISQKKIKEILKMDIKETLNNLFFQGKVKDIHSIHVGFL